VIQNHGVSLLDAAHQFGFVARMQRGHARQFAQHLAFRCQVVVDQIGDYHFIRHGHAWAPD